MDILVFAEQRDGKLKKTACEAVSVGRSLADETDGNLTAVVVGSGVKNIAKELGKFGADNILVADDERLDKFVPSAYSRVVSSIIKNENPDVVLFPFSSMGKDIVPSITARLGVSAASDCTKIEIINGEIICHRPVYSGKAVAKVSFSNKPVVISLRPNTFSITEKPVSPNITEVKIDLASDDFLTVIKEIVSAESKRPELTEADIIVSGGRGMGGSEKFSILEELADLLGAAVGASRSAVDAGWRPQKDQVGQTGKTVSPDLYIACGISGAIQHIAGISSAKYIVAINNDTEAPIFKVADYGIIGDLFEVVPAMIDELKNVT